MYTPGYSDEASVDSFAEGISWAEEFLYFLLGLFSDGSMCPCLFLSDVAIDLSLTTEFEDLTRY